METVTPRSGRRHGRFVAIAVAAATIAIVVAASPLAVLLVGLVNIKFGDASGGN